MTLQKTKPLTVLFLLFFGTAHFLASESCEDFARQHPAKARELIESFDLSQSGLQSVQEATAKQNWTEACRRLLKYYRTRVPELQKKPEAFTIKRNPAADLILQGKFTFQGATAAQARRTDGGLDWQHRGPKSDPEWAALLNRHLYFFQLLEAWEKTGNSEYAAGFSELARDWVETNPPPKVAPQTGPWRAMEIGRRLTDVWPQVFYGFQHAREFDDATRLLMLTSVAQQAEFCIRHHTRRGNHLNAEMAGLAAAAAFWPEFKDAPKWLDYAAKTSRRELNARVYPDGVYKELSNHYQIVMARHTDRLARLLARSGHPALHKEFLAQANKLWDYMLQVAKPNGFGPLNNDGDIENNLHWLDDAAPIRGLPAWPRPEGGLRPVFYPWAGHAIMRSGKDWLFFDAGPLGTAHQHYDKLHISLHTGGRDVLVDAGRYTYQPGPWRRYFTGPWSHNVVVIDDGLELLEPRAAKKPARAAFHSGERSTFALAGARFWPKRLFSFDFPVHKRAVLYVHDEYWLVADRMITSKQCKITVPWHFHPDCDLEREGTSLSEKKSGLRFVPVGKIDWKLDVISGQTRPRIQGWHSPRYNEKLPCPTAVYSTRISRPATFAWLISKDQTARAEVLSSSSEKISLKITKENGSADKITINWETSSCQIQNPE